jgi:mannose-6-phosphate isomerase-like protein (cupin superfamily)
MSGPIRAAKNNHYPWGSGCDGWHLLQTGELSVIEERMPPGTEEQRHFHERTQQFFYVMQGELVIEVDGHDHLLSVGDGLEIAPRQRHQVRNRSRQDVRFIVISQPPSHGDRQQEEASNNPPLGKHPASKGE